MMESFDAIWPRHSAVVDIDDEWLHSFLRQTIGTRRRFKKQLLGGLVNTNYLIEFNGAGPVGSSNKYFLRVLADRNGAAAEKEDSILALVRDDLPVTKTIGVDTYSGHTAMLQEWLPGRTLKSVVGLLDERDLECIGESIGGALAQLASVEFPAHGFLASNGKLERQFRLDRGGYLEYVESALHATCSVLGAYLCGDVWSFLLENAHRMNDFPTRASLAHGDFHPNNILVQCIEGSWQLTGIVDWESALSWNVLHDVSHLLRRSYPGRSSIERGVLRRLRAENVWLPDDWKATRGLIQILGWVDKLAAGEVREPVVEAAKVSLRDIVGGQWVESPYYRHKLANPFD